MMLTHHVKRILTGVVVMAVSGAQLQSPTIELISIKPTPATTST
jgi:hypothetical protein